jgi:chromosome partitioning protein
MCRGSRSDSLSARVRLLRARRRTYTAPVPEAFGPVPSIAFATIKGGVGKTTLAVHAAAALADLGHRVLFLDFDPQGHSSTVLGVKDDQAGERPCLGDALGPKPRLPLSEVAVPSPRRPSLWVAPAALRMAAQERDLFQWGHRLQAIVRALRTLGWQPDVVVADTPPNLGAYTEAALNFCQLIAVPVPMGAFALQGMGELAEAFRAVREDGGELVVIVNLIDRRTQATNAAVEDALKDLEAPVLETRIPRAEALNQAGLAYEVIFDTSPSAPVTTDLRALAAELARRVGLRARP